MITAIVFVAVLVAATVVTFVLVNRRAAGKVGFLGRAQLGKLGRAAENADPVGQMRQAVDDAADRIGTAREALVRAGGAKSALERQVKTDESEVATLTARINRKLDGGVAADGPEMKGLAEELGRAKKFLAANQAQLAETTRLCNDSLGVIRHENEKVADMARRADRLEVQLDVSKAQAAVADVAAYMTGTPSLGLDQTASKFEAIAMKQVDENNARLQVYRDTAGARVEDEAVDLDGQAALDEILARRKAPAA